MKFFVDFGCFVFVLKMVRLCSPGWPRTRYADQAGLSSIEISCVCFPSAGIKSVHHHNSRLSLLTQLHVFSHSWTSIFITLISQALRPRAHTVLGHLTYFLFGLSRSHSLTGASAEKHTCFFPPQPRMLLQQNSALPWLSGKGIPREQRELVI